MDKKDICIIIIGILIIAILLFLIFEKNDKSIQNNVNEVNNIQEIEQNSIENIIVNSTDNEELSVDKEGENADNDEEQAKPETEYQSELVYETNDNVGTTDKKEEAISMVKTVWGPDEDASFRCDSITSNGEYIIAVTSKSKATVSGFFRVNLEKKTVTVEF